MPETIEAGELQIDKVFSNEYLFEIPEYQRPYAWTTEEVGDLLDDLFYAMKKGDGKCEDIGEMPPYFLGSVVVIKNSDSAHADIVDGQQRITTLTLLFCALRELSANDENLRNDLNKRVREESDSLTGVEGRFRLAVRKRDRDFFLSNVQTEGALADLVKQPPSDLPDSQQRMFENAEYLWSKLSKLNIAQHRKLASFLVRRCYLVVVSASDRSSAYRVFAVMNDRGLDLSPTDILKADIIGEMDDNVRSQYTEVWEDMEEHLGRDGFRDLFAHIRMIYMKDKARGTLNQEFRDGVISRIADRNFIDEVLAPFADTYEIVTRASYKSEKRADEINLYLDCLGRLDNDNWIPPAMAFFNRNEDNEDMLFRFVVDLERLAYGMFIMRQDINQRINRYADVLRAIERGDDLYGETSPLQLTDREKGDILQRLDGEIYTLPRVPRPLLLRLDGLVADAGAKYDHPAISIEHVLPQNPESSSEWIIAFGDEEEREYWTHRLANLVLLSHRKNSQAQNYDFERKKKAYFMRSGTTPFALTTQVVNEPAWIPDVLKRRQRILVDALAREWRLSD